MPEDITPRIAPTPPVLPPPLTPPQAQELLATYGGADGMVAAGYSPQDVLRVEQIASQPDEPEPAEPSDADVIQAERDLEAQQAEQERIEGERREEAIRQAAAAEAAEPVMYPAQDPEAYAWAPYSSVPAPVAPPTAEPAPPPAAPLQPLVLVTDPDTGEERFLPASDAAAIAALQPPPPPMVDPDTGEERYFAPADVGYIEALNTPRNVLPTAPLGVTQAEIDVAGSLAQQTAGAIDMARQQANILSDQAEAFAREHDLQRELALLQQANERAAQLADSYNSKASSYQAKASTFVDAVSAYNQRANSGEASPESLREEYDRLQAAFEDLVRERKDLLAELPLVDEALEASAALMAAVEPLRAQYNDIVARSAAFADVYAAQVQGQPGAILDERIATVTNLYDTAVVQQATARAQYDADLVTYNESLAGRISGEAALAPYKVGEGYDIFSALRAGVPVGALYEIGYTPEQVSEAATALRVQDAVMQAGGIAQAINSGAITTGQAMGSGYSAGQVEGALALAPFTVNGKMDVARAMAAGLPASVLLAAGYKPEEIADLRASLQALSAKERAVLVDQGSAAFDITGLTPAEIIAKQKAVGLLDASALYAGTDAQGRPLTATAPKGHPVTEIPTASQLLRSGVPYRTYEEFEPAVAGKLASDVEDVYSPITQYAVQKDTYVYKGNVWKVEPDGGVAYQGPADNKARDLLAFVPVVGTVTFWNERSPWENAISVGVDVLTIAFLAKAGPGGAKALAEAIGGKPKVSEIPVSLSAETLDFIVGRTGTLKTGVPALEARPLSPFTEGTITTGGKIQPAVFVAETATPGEMALRSYAEAVNARGVASQRVAIVEANVERLENALAIAIQKADPIQAEIASRLRAAATALDEARNAKLVIGLAETKALTKAAPLLVDEARLAELRLQATRGATGVGGGGEKIAPGVGAETETALAQRKTVAALQLQFTENSVLATQGVVAASAEGIAEARLALQAAEQQLAVARSIPSVTPTVLRSAEAGIASAKARLMNMLSARANELQPEYLALEAAKADPALIAARKAEYTDVIRSLEIYVKGATGGDGGGGPRIADFPIGGGGGLRLAARIPTRQRLLEAPVKPIQVQIRQRKGHTPGIAPITPEIVNARIQAVGGLKIALAIGVVSEAEALAAGYSARTVNAITRTAPAPSRPPAPAPVRPVWPYEPFFPMPIPAPAPLPTREPERKPPTPLPAPLPAPAKPIPEPSPGKEPMVPPSPTPGKPPELPPRRLPQPVPIPIVTEPDEPQRLPGRPMRGPQRTRYPQPIVIPGPFETEDPSREPSPFIAPGVAMPRTSPQPQPQPLRQPQPQPQPFQQPERKRYPEPVRTRQPFPVDPPHPPPPNIPRPTPPTPPTPRAGLIVSPPERRTPKGKTEEKRYPQVVVYRRGEFWDRLDFNTGRVTSTNEPPSGFTERRGATPAETYTVILWDDDPPYYRTIPMGVVDITASEGGISFKRSPRARAYPPPVPVAKRSGKARKPKRRRGPSAGGIRLV